jgi:SpoVK/Ycf46/Vps4 family AAA+-type ATPase
MGPVREIAHLSSGNLKSIDAHSMPPVSPQHFLEAFEAVLPTVSAKDLHRYVEWNNEFGSFRRMV